MIDNTDEELKNNNNVDEKNILTDDNKKINQTIDNIDLKKELKTLQDIFVNHKSLLEKEISTVRNRIDRDVKNIYKFSLEKIIISLLPVIDSLECAFKLFDNEYTKHISTIIESILNDFLFLLKEYNVKIINETNVVFNPEIHQAMSLVMDPNIKDNHVVSTIQKGYLLHNRLLRPAMVIVSKC
ncbi:Protein GrpE [Buchnera aphidicola (Eriosoma lanigerum)]|uniref:nucleotide exchange factor GrpE n=1 Tax=Buchnera aphidicola TaxID=9 RepID=UPI00346385C4